MVPNINNTNDKQEKTGMVKVSELSREGESLTELSSSEQRQIKGGTPRTKTDSTNVPRRGDGNCDEWGCGANHNETLVTDRVWAEPVVRDSSSVAQQASCKNGT